MAKIEPLEMLKKAFQARGFESVGGKIHKHVIPSISYNFGHFSWIIRGKRVKKNVGTCKTKMSKEDQVVMYIALECLNGKKAVEKTSFYFDKGISSE